MVKKMFERLLFFVILLGSASFVFSQRQQIDDQSQSQAYSSSYSSAAKSNYPQRYIPASSSSQQQKYVPASGQGQHYVNYGQRYLNLKW